MSESDLKRSFDSISACTEEDSYSLQDLQKKAKEYVPENSESFYQKLSSVSSSSSLSLTESNPFYLFPQDFPVQREYLRHHELLDSYNKETFQDFVSNKTENKLIKIHFEIVTNDGREENNKKLIDLKTIFSKQLPKMPREYIVRLVFDRRHFTLALVKSVYQYETSKNKSTMDLSSPSSRRLISKKQSIIGGICYRSYHLNRFYEIAFCAITANEQVRGYGSLMMSMLKIQGQHEDIEYMITYADNFAIGYFQKQGFSKNIYMGRERWLGYIKEYDGGTPMECYIHPGIDFSCSKKMIQVQKKFIEDRINEVSKSKIVYDSLTNYPVHNLTDVPGVIENGWTSHVIYRGITERDRNAQLNKVNGIIRGLFSALLSHPTTISIYQLYKAPSFPSGLPGIDLTYINSKIEQGAYYRSKEACGSDLLRMVEFSLHSLPKDRNTTSSLEQFKLYINKNFFEEKEKEKKD